MAATNISVKMHDTGAGLRIDINDRTTGQNGSWWPARTTTSRR